MKLSGISERVANRIGGNSANIKKIFKEVMTEIIAVLETEEPVTIDGFGEFYFTYRKISDKHGHDSRNDHIKHRKIRFRPVGYIKELFNRKCLSIGIQSSSSVELKKIGVSTDLIPLIREEVNKAGLASQLLVRRMNSEITYGEIAANLSYVIKKMDDK